MRGGKERGLGASAMAIAMGGWRGVWCEDGGGRSGGFVRIRVLIDKAEARS